MSTWKKLGLLIADLLVLYVSLSFTILFRYGQGLFAERLKDHLGPFSFIFGIWLLVFYLADLYRHKTFRNKTSFFRTLIPALLIANLVSIVFFYLFGGLFELTPKTNLFILSAVFLILEYGVKSALFEFFRTDKEGILLLGNSLQVEEIVHFLQGAPHSGYELRGWLKDEKKIDFETLKEVISSSDTKLIVVQGTLVKDPQLTAAIYRLLPLGVNVTNFSDFYELIFEKVPLDELEESWFIEHIAPRQPWYDAAKRTAEFVIALLGGLILSPFILLIACAIVFTSEGRVIYPQSRAGKNGKGFTLYKFRTMREAKPGDNWTLWTEQNDTRLTSFGKFLRFTHLDEIPQLWNVIRGDISLIGPRPERVELAEKYSEVPYYEIRHVVKPGLTGWAQINYKPSASIEEAKEKLCYDVYYVKNRSLLTDLVIVIRTLRYLFISHQ